MKPTDRKTEIITVAAQLFKEKGYSAVTMRDIAQAMNIKAASLYNHIKSKQEIAAAPAPETTILISSIFLPVISSAFNNAADAIIAVPCWSSWNTGIFMRLRNSFSI